MYIYICIYSDIILSKGRHYVKYWELGAGLVPFKNSMTSAVGISDLSL